MKPFHKLLENLVFRRKTIHGNGLHEKVPATEHANTILIMDYSSNHYACCSCTSKMQLKSTMKNVDTYEYFDF